MNREIKPPNGVIETVEQKNKRLLARWDSSCSFESSYDWLPQLKNVFGITTLVDELGDPVDHNLPDQADMCEIVRATISAGLLAPIATDVTNIPFEALSYISCPGSDSIRICAVNGISYYKTDMWTILFEGMGLQIDGHPNFIKSSFISNKIEHLPDAGIPINKQEIQALRELKDVNNLEIQKLIAKEKDDVRPKRTKNINPSNKVLIQSSVYNKETIKANAGWTSLDSGKVEFSANRDVYVIAYSMISGYAMKSRLTARLLLDDVNQISSRMIQGYMDYPTITTGLVTHLQSGKHRVETQYRVSAKLSLDLINKETENIITGLIIIPLNQLFQKKVINPNEIQLFNDNSWADFPNLQANFKFKKSSYILVMYNIAMPGMNSHIITRVDINSVPIIV